MLALCARRVDGLIVIPASGDHRYLLPEIAAGVASVFVDRRAGLIDANAVLADNVGAPAQAWPTSSGTGTAGSGSSGTTRASTRPPSASRATGTRWPNRAAGGAGLGIHGQPTPDSVRDALTAMLAGPAPVTALFCGNNRVTILALRATAGHRMRWWDSTISSLRTW